MKAKVSPAVIGAFVIGAFVLATLALLSFGGFHFFDKPERFVVYVDESVSGLDQGSPVKMRGVRVGRVTSLGIRYDAAKSRSVVAVVCELNRDMVRDPSGALIDVSSKQEMQKMVDRGLRAQLGVLGLATGLLFIELDFKEPDPAEKLPVPVQGEPYVVVPWVPSTISELQSRIANVLGEIEKVNFAALAKDIAALAQTARKQIDAADIKGLVDQWKKTGAEFAALANNADFKRTFDSVNGAVADLRVTIAKIDAQIEPSGAELRATLVEARKAVLAFNETAATAKQFLASQSGLGDELIETLDHVSEAADSVKRLADFIERNPNALISGRKRPQ
ncbi:MAG: MlaD family protein [Verrucomicrobiota bacterium]